MNDQDKAPESTSTPPTPPSAGSELPTIGALCKSIIDSAPPPLTEEQIRQRDVRRRAQQEASAIARRKAEWQSLSSRIGERYANCTLANFEADHEPQKRVVAKLREYGELISVNVSEGRGIVFFGPKGTGKDHLMVAMLRCAVDSEIDVAWENGQDLFGNIRDRMDGDASESSLIHQFAKPMILAISDPMPVFGELTAHQANMLFRILDRRYRKKLPTWVTMNAKDGADAEKRMGGQLVDRLRDGALVVSCNWASYRSAAK